MTSPAFQFYVQDFITGTADMTAEEVGGYIRLLCRQWDKGSVPDDDKKLKQISGARAPALTVIRTKFIKGDDGLLRNARMEKVRQERDTFVTKQKANGSKGGNPNFIKGKSNPYYNPKDNPTDNPKINSSSSSSISTSSSFNDVVVDTGIKKYYESIQQDTAYTTQLCAMHHISLDELEDAVKEFFIKKTITGEHKQWNTEQQCRTHLMHWLPSFIHRKNKQDEHTSKQHTQHTQHPKRNQQDSGNTPNTHTLNTLNTLNTLDRIGRVPRAELEKRLRDTAKFNGV